MKNKKDRTNKKFNLVDFAIIAIIIILVIAVAWKLTSATVDADNEAAAGDAIAMYDSAPHMRFTVVCRDVPVDAAEVMLRNEDPQINNSYKDMPGYIIDVSTSPTVYELSDGITATNPNTCIVTFIIEGYYDEAEATEKMAYTLGTQEVRIGKSYIVKTKSIEYSGICTAMEVVNE